MISLKSVFMPVAISCSLIVISSLVDVMFHAGVVISDAQARFGRPLTAGSVAGVARRTTRRVVRRTTVYVAALPKGCTTVIIEGVTLRQCGTTYYQAHGTQYVVIRVE